MCWCTPSLRTPHCGKPTCSPLLGSPLKRLPATVQLNNEQIVEAISRYVAANGYTPSKVTIHCDPHQYNGPDSFRATVEV